MIWVEFVVCASLILLSGSVLTKYADVLAAMTGMGRQWIGFILLATVTSLPELATGISAVTVADAPDIAVGNALGACVVNLMLLAVIDLYFCRPVPLLSRVEQGHILAGGFGVLMMGIVAWGLLFSAYLPDHPLLVIGFPTPVLFILYFVAVRMVFRFEQRQMARFVKAEAEAMEYKELTKTRVYQVIAINAAIIVAAGVWLSLVGVRIVEETGLSGTFVGNIFVAIATTLPEMVTSVAALRLGAPDLAIANLFGSNLFNLMILAIDDLFYVKGPLLSDVSFTHMFPVTTALMMTGICIAGLIYRTQKKPLAMLGWDSAALVVLYLLNFYLLFAFSQVRVGPLS